MTWNVLDFAALAVVLAILGVAVMILLRVQRPLPYRLGFVMQITGTALLFWAGGAVGVIGSPDHPANLLFLLIMLTGVLGGVYGRFSPAALKRTLLIMAIMQVGVGTSALALGWGQGDPAWPMDVLAASLAFTIIWLLGAYFFRQADRLPPGL